MSNINSYALFLGTHMDVEPDDIVSRINTALAAIDERRAKPKFRTVTAKELPIEVVARAIVPVCIEADFDEVFLVSLEEGRWPPQTFDLAALTLMAGKL